MHTWIRVSLTVVLLSGIIVGKWWYDHQEHVARQWACYRVGAAPSLEQANSELAWFEEEGPERDARLGELVESWGTGNRQFDLYLAQYVGGPASSELLRETFSRQLCRRRELLARWAHYWSYRSPLEPDEEIASVVAYFDPLAATGSSSEEAVTWRQVLNLQAVLQLQGEERLAGEVSPKKWRLPYRRWQRTRPSELPSIERPATPFPE